MPATITLVTVLAIVVLTLVLFYSFRVEEYRDIIPSPEELLEYFEEDKKYTGIELARKVKEAAGGKFRPIMNLIYEDLNELVEAQKIMVEISTIEHGIEVKKYFLKPINPKQKSK